MSHERNGAARSRGPLGSPSASSNKLGCRRLPAPGHRRLTGYPVLLRGELTLDFPLPASASGGQRSQPCIGAYDGRRTRTSDHTSRSRRRRRPVPRSRDASKPALSKCREPNPASVFHRHPPNNQDQTPTTTEYPGGIGGPCSHPPTQRSIMPPDLTPRTMKPCN